MNERKNKKKVLDAYKETPEQRKARLLWQDSAGVNYARIIPCAKKKQSRNACRGNFPKEVH